MSELGDRLRALAARLRALTPARVGLGRTGVSQETRDLLDFQRAHALARDAVHARLEAAALAAELGEMTGGRSAAAAFGGHGPGDVSAAARSGTKAG